MHRTKKINLQLSFVIPVFNEEKRLKKGMEIAINYLSNQTYASELILVNDGSTDNTKNIINKFHRQKINKLLIRIINSPTNIGKGGAISKGVLAATGKYIFFSDVDFSTPISNIQKFMSQLTKNDITIGSRRLDKSNIKKHQNFIREFLGKGFTLLSNFILGLNHSDLTCGFKGFKNKVAKKLFKLQKINGWAFDPEILFLAKKFNYQVKEIPVLWKNDPNTKVNLFTDLPLSLYSLLTIPIIHQHQ